MRSTQAYGTHSAFIADYGPDSGDRPQRVTIFAPHPAKGRGELHTGLIGLLWDEERQAVHWLSEKREQIILGSDATTDEGLILATFQHSNMTIMLDPHHSFLPVIVVDGGQKFDRVHWTTEFQSLRSGRWFPKAGFTKTAPKFDRSLDRGASWTIRDVHENEPLPPELFEPPLRPGTQVTDARTGKTYVIGADDAPGDVAKALAADVRRAAKDQDSAPIRAAQTWFATTSGRWLLILAVLLLLTAATLRVVVRQSR